MLLFVGLLYICSTAASYAGGFRDRNTHASGTVIEKRIPQSCSAISPAPSQLVCGELGYAQLDPDEYGYTELAGPQIVDDFETCRDYCLSRTTQKNRPSPDKIYCRSFSYDQASGLCTLSHYRLRFQNGAKFMPNDTSTTAYWSVRCFECPNRCPQQVNGVNLLDNPGFELSNKLPGPWTSATSIVRHGFNSSNAGTPSDLMEQYFNTCPGELYKVQYDFYFGDAYKSDELYYGFVDAGDLDTELGPIPQKKIGWATYEFTFRAKDDVSYFRYTTAGGGLDGLYVDNVNVTAVSNDTISLPDSPNLLTNGGFETGLLAPWAISYTDDTPHPTSIVSPGLTPDSQYALKIKLNSTDLNWDVWLTQNVPDMQFGGKYLVTVNYKVIGSHRAPTLVGGAVWNNGFQPLDREPEDANGVKTMQRIVTVGYKSKHGYFGLEFEGYTTKGITDEVTIYIDNASIQPLD